MLFFTDKIVSDSLMLKMKSRTKIFFIYCFIVVFDGKSMLRGTEDLLIKKIGFKGFISDSQDFTGLWSFIVPVLKPRAITRPSYFNAVEIRTSLREHFWSGNFNLIYKKNWVESFQFTVLSEINSSDYRRLVGLKKKKNSIEIIKIYTAAALRSFIVPL